MVINIKNGVDSLVIIIRNNVHSHRYVKQIFQQETEITGIRRKVGSCLRENQINYSFFTVLKQVYHFRAFVNFLIPCDVNIDTNQPFIHIISEPFSVIGTMIAGRARKLMRRLGMWAAGYDCAIVLIGHLNKKEGSKGLYRSLGSIDVVAAARSVLQVERDTENPDIRIVHQIKNSLAPTAEDIRFSISADKGFRWLECRPQLFEKQQPDVEPEFDTEQQKAAYWIKHFLEKGDMSANEIYCRLDNEGVSKRVARMVKTEMGIHCYQKKRKWYWSVQPEEGVMNGPQV